VKKKLTPQTARTETQILALPRELCESEDWLLGVDEDAVYITEQKMGQAPTQKLKVPKRSFDILIRWYQTGLKR
jgi:hypothetical protein